MLNERSDVLPLITEAFRELGYEGATLSRITQRTGLGKGSLYHFFPSGKEAMAEAILSEISKWFEQSVFVPLEQDDPVKGISVMWNAVDDYFPSGDRVCLVGAFALDTTRDRFSTAIAHYFKRWIETLGDALMRTGLPARDAHDAAEDAVLAIQGALVLSRAVGDPALFGRACSRSAARLRELPGKGDTG